MKQDGIIFIPGNVPSLKNSKVKASRGIFHSPTVAKYIRKLGIQNFSSRKKEVRGYVDISRPNVFESFRKDFEDMKFGKENPIFIGYHQVRRDRRLFDWSNSVELIQDLLTAHDFIEDDNVKYCFPIPMTKSGKLPTKKNIRNNCWYSVDKENPGVYIKVF